jgi:fatty-acyl-CoA synthase
MGLFEMFHQSRGVHPQLFVRTGDGDLVTRTWDQWRDRSAQAAGGLRRRGVSPGDRVACILSNVPAACEGLPGVWMAGATVVSMPMIARGMSFEAYLGLLRGATAQVGADLLLVEARFASALDEHLPGVQVVAWEDVFSDPVREPDPPSDDDIVFIQYSSGSTSVPKGCMLTGQAVEAQMRALADATCLDPKADHVSMWIPLSHDMSFFGGLTFSLWGGHSLSMMSPERYMRSPGAWLREWAEREATFSAVPNFGLAALNRRVQTVPDRLRMRFLVIGGEQVERDTVERSAELLAPAGVPRSAFVPAYGLAEAVLAVTMKARDEEPAYLTVATDELAEHRVAIVDEQRHGSMTLTSTGRPVGDARVRIDHEAGGEGVGEICITSTSMASGYVANEELTRERFTDGELRTRDLGFVHEGHLYVLGRTDDMLSVHGRNVYARDIETALYTHEKSVRPGCCVLIDVSEGGQSRLLVVAELADEGVVKRKDAYAGLAQQITEAALEHSGVGVDECAFFARGTLPKTPSGKIQRFRCREMVESGDDAILARVRV